MTILTDREIKYLCSYPVPTHRGSGRLFCIDDMSTDLFYKDKDDYVEISSGIRYNSNNIKEAYKDIKELSSEEIESLREPPMITPFVPHQVKEIDGKKIVSYGLSSMGYDVRLANKFKIFTNVYGDTIDPLNMSETTYVDYEGDSVIIPPNSYILGHTVETFSIPKDVLAICVGKSTWARAAAIVNVTPIEPGFCGNVVIEIANLSTLPLRIHSGMGIAQFLFLKGDECEISYADRGGKYQNQIGVQTAIV